MTFVSIQFFIFIIVFLAIYKVFEHNLSLQNIVIIIGNYVFYCLIDIRFSIVLFIVSLFSSVIANKIEKKKSKQILIFGILGNISVLIFFKYIGFWGTLATRFGIVMPIGLSFYVFEAISYISDTYNGKIKEHTSVWDVILYLSFFPIVISGPIVKARDFLPQIHKKRCITLANFENGMQWFFWGMLEKVVIADRLAVAVDAVYSVPSAYSGISLLWNSLSYSLQLFFDFAGYSNMAIGIALILGFHVKENFNLPYIARSPSDFWKRWHISLSSWFTEYVYIPLGGNRSGKCRTLINIMITMIISGIWHGSTLNFVFWGACHGIAQVIQKIFKDVKKKSCLTNKFLTGLGMTITFTVVNFLWIPFRTDNLSTTILVFKRILTNANGLTYIYSYTLLFLIALVTVECYALVKNKGNNPIRPVNLRTFSGKLIFLTEILVMVMFAYFGNSAFIYGAF